MLCAQRQPDTEILQAESRRSTESGSIAAGGGGGSGSAQSVGTSGGTLHERASACYCKL